MIVYSFILIKQNLIVYDLFILNNIEECIVFRTGNTENTGWYFKVDSIVLRDRDDDERTPADSLIICESNCLGITDSGIMCKARLYYFHKT